MSSTLRAEVCFLKPESLPTSEKPYLLRFETNDADLPTSNYQLQTISVEINDIRPHLSGISFADCGYDVLDLDSSLRTKDYDDHRQVTEIWLPELVRSIRDHLNASKVTVIPHVIDGATGVTPYTVPPVDGVVTALYKIRKRHPLFPTSTGCRYEYEQPTNIAHIGR